MATVNHTAELSQDMFVSWKATSLAWQLDDVMQQQEGEFQDLSKLPELSDASRILSAVSLPIESLLVRHISLPLQSPKLVDAEMLFQTLADSIELEDDAWWLSWDLRVCDDGIAGMLFAIPESLRISMQEDSQWSNVKHVIVDGYERLQAYMHDDACLVIDQDAEGLCFGVYDGQVWQGVRRLSGVIDEACIKQLWRSATTMGFHAGVLCGRVGVELETLLAEYNLHWQVEVVDVLPQRHEANLACMQLEPTLNLRHGRWSASQSWEKFEVWKRSALLTSLLLVSWLIGIGVESSRMDTQINTYSQRIEAAFHQGLPNEPVMLDALAQLRQAAGSSTSAQSVFLLSLQDIAQVYKHLPWQLKLLELRDGVMYMSGEVKDIKTLNQIQSELAKVLTKQVSITDTNISKKSVSFRMHW